ncbi:MAG: hypothetical protein KDJ65_30930 [Anaerolineae bacterium]|nr:hypothetical protein [Anaerolineae bacterium]
MTPSLLKSYAGLILVLLLFVTLAFITSLRTPLAAGPDETAHFMFARFLAQHGYLPFSPEDRTAAGYKSDQPPLNSALVAALYGGNLDAPPYAKLTHNVPRRHIAIMDLAEIPNWLVLNTEDPWRGEIGLWRLGRLISIIVSALTLVVVYHTGLFLVGDQPWRHLAATATVSAVAFIPTFVFISSVFSYENLLGLCLSLFLLTAVYLVERNDRPRWLYLLAGLWIGLAIVTKLSALTAPLLLLGLIIFLWRRAGWSWRTVTERLALAALGLLLGAGWWFVTVELALNRVDDLGWLAGLLHPILIADGSDQTSLGVAELLSGGQIGAVVKTGGRIFWYEWLERFFRSFWQYQWHFPALLYYSLLLLTGLIIAGWVRGWRRSALLRRWLPLLLLYSATFLLLPLVRFIFIQQTHAGLGQHLLFPAVGAFALLLTWGLGAWLPTSKAWPWLGGFALGLAMFVWSGLQAVQLYEPPLPVRTAPPLQPAHAEAANLDFGPLLLTGFSLPQVNKDSTCCAAAASALTAQLFWHSQEIAPENYIMELRLIDTDGQAQSVWTGHPADGRYLTKAWEPGDGVRVEGWLPLSGLLPGRYALALRLLGAGGPLLPDGQADAILTEIELAQPPPLPDTVRIWQSGQPVEGRISLNPWQAVQITVPSTCDLQLIGPDETIVAPLAQAGSTWALVIDPRWSRGEYTVRHCENEATLWVDNDGRPTTPPPIQTSLEANFANQLQLLGYNLPQRQIAPDQRMPVTLTWQALHSIPADLLMFTRLRDAEGQVWGGYDRRPREFYSTLLWVADEVVADSFSIPVEADAPPGLYYLDVGFYLPMGEAAVSLPLVQQGEMSDVSNVTIGPIKIGSFAAPFLRETATPQTPMDQPFGDDSNITLLGFDLSDAVGQSSTNATSEAHHVALTLYWRSDAPLDRDYTTFVHLRNAGGETVAQHDQPPAGGAYPTGVWSPGEIIVDEVRLPLPDSLPPADYRLVAGLYDPSTGQRLPVPGQSANEVMLTSVQIGP